MKSFVVINGIAFTIDVLKSFGIIEILTTELCNITTANEGFQITEMVGTLKSRGVKVSIKGYFIQNSSQSQEHLDTAIAKATIRASL